MGSGSKKTGSVIMKELSGRDELLGRNPAVLSCGGIYIPHKGREDSLYHILNTPSRLEPVKVVTGARPVSALYEMLIREPMN